MLLQSLLLVSVVYEASAIFDLNFCYDVSTINRGVKDDLCDQPLFVNFMRKTSENELLDNVCHTYFPLPDDPNTVQLYESRVFCDGSHDVTSFIVTQIKTGVTRIANPFLTATNYIIGYSGCDTYILYRCANFGGYNDFCYPEVYGLSKDCRAIGLSCLRKVEEVISDQCLPDQDFYILPMKLPHRCVTQQLCTQPPNPFYGNLPGAYVI